MQSISSTRFILNEQHWPWQQRLSQLHLVSCQFNHQPLTQQHLADYNFALPKNLAKAAPKRRAEFMAGRLCARRAIARVAGKEQLPKIGADRAPLWPQGLVGTISHSDTWAGALVGSQANYLGVGLDIERCLSVLESQKLASALLTANEYARIKNLSPAQFAFMVTVSFSLKESLFKALYPLVNKHFYFQDAELVAWDIAGGSARVRLLTSLSSIWPTGSELNGHFCQYEQQVWSLLAIRHPS